MNGKASKIEDILKSKGYRLTDSRKKIIKVFIDNDKHLKPENVYELVKMNNISLPTVYRTIEILKKNDIIKEITINNNRYYELKLFSEKCMHIHFKCKKCNKIKDCTDKKLILDLIKLKNLAEEVYNIEGHDINITINGICNSCRR